MAETVKIFSVLTDGYQQYFQEGAMRFLKLRFCVLALVAMGFAQNDTIRGFGYSPFRGNENPNGTSPTYQEIVSDIVMAKPILSLPPFTPYVRTFGIDKNYLRWIPAVCESLSVNYTISGWTSFLYPAVDTWLNARNDIVSFLKHADSSGYKHLAGIIYGYENVSEASTAYPLEADKVKYMMTQINLLKPLVAPYHVPIGHEENWDVYLRHPELADSLDFVTIRIVPQTDLVPLSSAVKYVLACYDTVKNAFARYDKLKKAFPAKRVIAATIGWSTAGSSEAEQKKFLSDFVSAAKFDYYLFELTDETWDGNYYGLFTAARQPKLYLSNLPSIDFSHLFSSDTTKLDGMIYNFNCFGYPQQISLTALQKSITGWADTFNQIAKIALINTSDFTQANGTLPALFRQEGNKVGIISNGGYNWMPILKGNYADLMVFNFGNIFSNYAGQYGSMNAAGRQTFVDNLRHNFVIPARDSSLNDSVCLAISIGDYQGPYWDSLVKYPEIVADFDAVVCVTDLYYLGQYSLPSQYTDSLVAAVRKAIGPSKKLIFLIDDLSDLLISNYARSMPKNGYLALTKAKSKYDCQIVFSDIGNFYTNQMTTPSDQYKFLMPWRFVSAINRPELAQKIDFGLSFAGRKVIINLVGKSGEFFIFDAKGREIKKITITASRSVLNLESFNLSQGLWIMKLVCAGKTKTARYIF
ncbi:MAG TPA: hypothetical protein VMD74_02115 [Candidatus Methylomirabilis sp.]|nr:hypothetical protein [Candidatus Methylomirabilis sp.]